MPLYRRQETGGELLEYACSAYSSRAGMGQSRFVVFRKALRQPLGSRRGVRSAGRCFSSVTALMVVCLSFDAGTGSWAAFLRETRRNSRRPGPGSRERRRLPPQSTADSGQRAPTSRGLERPGWWRQRRHRRARVVDMTTPAQESTSRIHQTGRCLTPRGHWPSGEIRAGFARGWPGESGQRLFADPGSFCLNAMPRISFAGQEIVQKPDSLILLSANVHRVIPTDGRPPLVPGATSWLGSSRDRWDGDTLVVEVTGLNGRSWFDSAGNF